MQDFSARRNYCFLFTLLSFDLLDSFRFSFVLRICLVLRIFVHDLYMPPRSLSADIDGLMSLFRFGIWIFGAFLKSWRIRTNGLDIYRAGTSACGYILPV